jgi:transposase-like protein
VDRKRRARGADAGTDPGTIEAIVEEELEEALGATRSQRVGANRTGYRHGKRPRTLSSTSARPGL